MSAEQHRHLEALAGELHQQHSQLHVCLTSLMFLRSQWRTPSKAVPSRLSGSPAQSLAPPGWSCMSSQSGPVLPAVGNASAEPWIQTSTPACHFARVQNIQLALARERQTATSLCTCLASLHKQQVLQMCWAGKMMQIHWPE